MDFANICGKLACPAVEHRESPPEQCNPLDSPSGRQQVTVKRQVKLHLLGRDYPCLDFPYFTIVQESGSAAMYILCQATETYSYWRS